MVVRMTRAEPKDRPGELASARVEFRAFDAALLAAFIERRSDDAAQLLDAELEPGWPDAHDDTFLRIRLEDIAQSSSEHPWAAFALVQRVPVRRMIGHAGFHGPPGVNALGLEGAVELGYTVFPSFRRRGYATEVAAGLIDWARGTHGVTQFVASVSPSNTPSVATVTKLGFVFVSEKEDDLDGLEYVYLLNH